MKRLLYLFFSFFIIYLGFTDLYCCVPQGHIMPTRQQKLIAIINSSRPIRIFIRPEVSEHHTRLIEESLERFNTLPRIRIVTTNNVFIADAIVYYWNNTANNNFIGYQPTNTDRILLDINRINKTGGDAAIQAVFLHEIGHWLGMNHVCKYVGERDHCSPVGYGNAIMNPVVEGNFAQYFTDLDIAEFHRVSGL